MSGAASETYINCKLDESVTRGSIQYLRLAVKRNFVGVLQHKNYYGIILQVAYMYAFVLKECVCGVLTLDNHFFSDSQTLQFPSGWHS